MGRGQGWLQGTSEDITAEMPEKYDGSKNGEESTGMATSL